MRNSRVHCECDSVNGRDQWYYHISQPKRQIQPIISCGKFQEPKLLFTTDLELCQQYRQSCVIKFDNFQTFSRNVLLTLAQCQHARVLDD